MSDDFISLRVMITSCLCKVCIGPFSEERWNYITDDSCHKAFTIKVSKKLNEFNIKLELKKKGCFLTPNDDYSRRHLFFATGFEKSFIEIARTNYCKGKSLEELGAKDNSLLIIF